MPETWQGQPVTGIGPYAFANQTQLRRVTLPKSISSIDNHAFYNCSSLEQLTLLKGVDSVGNGVLTLLAISQAGFMSSTTKSWFGFRLYFAMICSKG